MWKIVVQVSVARLAIALTYSSICPPGWTNEGGYCYSYTTGRALSWDDAVAACRQDGGQLMVESSDNEHAAFVKYRNSLQQTGDAWWIGVHVDATDNYWSFMYDYNPYPSAPLFENWVNNKNRPLTISGQCAATTEVNMTDKWLSYNCSSHMSYLCEVTPTPAPTANTKTIVCPNGYSAAGKYCYKVTTTPALSWEGARDACVAANSRLFLETSVDEHDAFLKYREKLSKQVGPIWVSVYIRESFNWALVGTEKNRTTFAYENWINGKRPASTSGQCAATVESSGSQVWQNLTCNLSLSFVCEVTPLNMSASNDTSSTDKYNHCWQRVYKNSVCKLPNLVVDANRSRTRTALECAVACTRRTGCAAFNYQRKDHTCQYILSHVEKSYVTPVQNWDVWVDNKCVV